MQHLRTLSKIIVLAGITIWLNSCGGGGSNPSGDSNPEFKSWGIPEFVGSDRVGRAYVPQIAIDTSGNAIAIWSKYEGARDTIFANYYSVNTGWGTAKQIDNNSGNAHSPQIAMDSSGNALAYGGNMM